MNGARTVTDARIANDSWAQLVAYTSGYLFWGTVSGIALGILWLQ